MTKLRKLESFIERIGNYSERLLAVREPPPPTENKQIVKEIRTLLDKRMSKHSSKPELTQYFNELFCGLDKVTTKSSAANHYTRDPLDPRNSEADIIDAFDHYYFRGKSTFKLACRLLSDPRVQRVEYFSKAVAQGGTILQKWTPQQREVFQLHIANKLWGLNRRNEARQKLLEDYELFWRQQLLDQHDATQLGRLDLFRLCRALVSTRAVPLKQLLDNTEGNWRSIYALWQNMVQTRTACPTQNINVGDHHLWRALVHVCSSPLLHAPTTTTTTTITTTTTAPAGALSKTAASIAPSFPATLNFIPSTAASAPHQIRYRLLQHAKLQKDSALLDVLLASSGGTDPVVEAGIVAVLTTDFI